MDQESSHDSRTKSNKPNGLSKEKSDVSKSISTKKEREKSFDGTNDVSLIIK